MNAIDNARRDGERGEGALFDVASCAEVEEPVGTLEVSCWSKAYSEFCALLPPVSWEGFFVCLGVCAEFYLQCLLKLMVFPFMSVHGEIVEYMPQFIGSSLSQKTVFSAMRAFILFGGGFRVKSSMYCGLVLLPI